jgi:hypothetical protein
MENFLLLLLVFAIILASFIWFYSHKSYFVQSVSVINSKTNNLTDRLAKDPPDVLSVSNLVQWRSLIKDLKVDRILRDEWMTSRFRPGAPPVLLKYNGQSIIYNAAFVDVTTTYDLDVEIYSPKMNIDETRELGLKLCNMFGYDSNNFSAWCNRVGNNWLDAPLFFAGDLNSGAGDQYHELRIGRTYSNNQPWYFVLNIASRSTLWKLEGKPSQ